ncbi:peroxidase 64 [Dorcoceras hygrometricum]|uniref:Peroxidase 64 n=1 Tax=Dorcoceras hygrometricum TaxID=472368 RepID=A0A2Z7CUT8_9LAMI|nr:peroxidase 64 [Dorcoceras hygrometricum]
MKFLGSIGEREVVVMVDSGASHNFVSRKLVTELGLPVDESVRFGVCLGDGGRVPCHGLCKGLIVDLHSCVVEVDCYAFQLGGVDLILGVDWLRTLGEVLTNWELMRMSFSIGKETVTLMGEPRLSRAVSSLKSMLKITDMEFCGAIWYTGNGELEEERQEGTTPPTTELEELLKQYERLFDLPRTLPPTRTQDHAIRLKEGQGPVQVRPYRYAHHQKDEIEKMISEMMQSGIIQPSCSPFSSPVILVKKKDGSWRFCVDYRSLNEATVTDKFPMPIIDELLDELHGAVWFSKLDMRSGYHQIRVRPEDVCKTAFRTYEGHYEFLVIPFGLMNAPTTFQATMNEILKPFLRKCVLVFLDDILIFSTDWGAHLKHLREVLDILEQNQLLLHKKKCVFGMRQVEYLGHIISGEGVSHGSRKSSGSETLAKADYDKRGTRFLRIDRILQKIYPGLWEDCETIDGSVKEG